MPGDGGGELWPLVGGVGKQFEQEGISSEQGGQHQHTTVPILDVGGMNDGVQQQPYRIDQDMPLLTLDPLACIIAGRIDPRPPFSALSGCRSRRRSG